MTIAQAISRVDRLKYNAYSLEEKRSWLGALEWLLKRNILDTHEGGLSFCPIGPDTPADTRLLAPEPFDELYPKWLEAQIDLYNGETERYNASILLFNAAYLAFESWYHRTYPPRGAGTWRV